MKRNGMIKFHSNVFDINAHFMILGEIFIKKNFWEQRKKFLKKDIFSKF
jgi:hypothetical protein